MPGIINLGKNQKACPFSSGLASLQDPHTGKDVGMGVIKGACLGEECNLYVISSRTCLFWHLYNLFVNIGNMLENIEAQTKKEIPTDLKE